MHVELIVVPWDSARRGERMGAGPERLLAAGLPRMLEQLGCTVTQTVVDPPAGAPLAEVRTAFDLARGVATRVRAARGGGRFPLVLTGNCGVASGVVAGLGADTAVLWFDAHGDFNTPETTTGGFLDGMALARLTGRCWHAMSEGIPGFAPVAEERVLLLGARDLDPLEERALGSSAVRRVAAGEVGPALGDRVRRELAGAARTYLHLDLDVLDPAEGRVNQYAAPAGVSLAALRSAMASLRSVAMPAAMTLSAYDPAFDLDGRVARATLDVVNALLQPVP
jgi:arginase